MKIREDVASLVLSEFCEIKINVFSKIFFDVFFIKFIPQVKQVYSDLLVLVKFFKHFLLKSFLIKSSITSFLAIIAIISVISSTRSPVTSLPIIILITILSFIIVGYSLRVKLAIITIVFNIFVDIWLQVFFTIHEVNPLLSRMEFK